MSKFRSNVDFAFLVRVDLKISSAIPCRYLAMSTEENLAIKAVLADIDTNRLPKTTFVDRLKRLKEVHKGLSEEVRSVLRDFKVVYVRLQRVLQDPSNLRHVVVKNEPDMQRLFAQGSNMLAQTYLDYIRDNSTLSPRRITSRNVSQGNSTRKHVGKRKRAANPPGDNGPTTPKRARTQDTGSTGRLLESHNSAQSASTATQMQRLLDIMATPPSKSAMTAQGVNEDQDDQSMIHAFEDIKSQVEAISGCTLDEQQGKRIAQLTTKPGPELEEVYQHAFGNDNWKPIAVELQSTNALTAKDFLQCVVWSFLILNIFDSQDDEHNPDKLPKPMPGARFLENAIDARAADGKSIMRVAVARQIGDSTFLEQVISPRASTLTNKLMLVLQAHLLQRLSKRMVLEATQSALHICRASLVLRAMIDNVDQRYSLRWYSRSADHRYDVAEMERSGDEHGLFVAFTAAPSLQREDGPMHMVLCRARVNVIVH